MLLERQYFKKSPRFDRAKTGTSMRANPRELFSVTGGNQPSLWLPLIRFRSLRL